MPSKKNYLIVFLLIATELIGFGLIIPILPQISERYATSGFWLGVLLSSYSLAQFLAAPLLGKWSDNIGRKPVLILSKVGTIASYILLAYANHYWLILASRLLDGASGGNIAVARAYLADITAPDNRSKAMAIIGVAFGTGFIFGPAIGGICYSMSNDFSVAGWVGAGCSLLSLIITLLFLKEPAQRTNTPSQHMIKHLNKLPSSAWLLMGLSAIGMIIFSGFESSFSVYTDHKFGFTPTQNSHLFLAIGVVAFFIQGSFTRISITPIKNAMTVAFLAIGAGLSLSALLTPIWGSLPPLALLIFGIAILNTHVPAELSQTATNKGLIMGIYESLNSLARILGPLMVFSILYTQTQTMYLYLGGLSFILVIATRYLKSS
ncbi:MAG: MFS transporter [Candidatus Marinamargulisbacteria bacterium]